MTFRSGHSCLIWFWWNAGFNRIGGSVLKMVVCSKCVPSFCFSFVFQHVSAFSSGSQKFQDSHFCHAICLDLHKGYVRLAGKHGV